MPTTRTRKSQKEVVNYSTSSDDFDSDDSEEDPSYEYEIEKAQSKMPNLSIKNTTISRDYIVVEVDDEYEIEKAQSKMSNLSIKNTTISRDYIDLEVDDEDVSDVETSEVDVEVQKLIEAGKIEKLKVDQCKVYLRKHGLRLTGKKDILIQRIKEHLEILKGGGEKKYPPSSFVLNCKGDACMGDIVMFEQTVYEGYNLASRSAIGPPCGKRIVAGRIVKESYGAAKQQHTFTVEVLWSKGEKALPPLHPLLIKGRNLYKLNTTRQRWEDEAERRRVLDEKHNRGFIARSDREARIHVKEARKMIKGDRTFTKVGQSSHHQNAKHESEYITQQRQTSQDVNLKFHPEFKGNCNQGMPRFPPNLAADPQQRQPLRTMPHYQHQQQEQMRAQQQQPSRGQQQWGKGQQANADEVRTLWIGHLENWIDENYVRDCFARKGEAVTVKIIRNKQTMQSEGYGFVTFSSHAGAERALQTYNLMPHDYRLNWALCGSEKKKVDETPDHTIFVGDLAADVTYYVLQDTFRAKYQSVKGAKVVMDRVTGRSKGYGFVRFGDETEQLRAIYEMNGVMCSGRAMRVGAANNKNNAA